MSAAIVRRPPPSKDTVLATFAGELIVRGYGDELPDSHQVPVPLGWLRQARAALVAEDRDYQPSHEALVDLVDLWAEHEALTGGGPNWQTRFRAALAVAQELTRREP